MSKKSIAHKYYGAFEVEEWPENLDEIVVKWIREKGSTKSNELSNQ